MRRNGGPLWARSTPEEIEEQRGSLFPSGLNFDASCENCREAWPCPSARESNHYPSNSLSKEAQQELALFAAYLRSGGRSKHGSFSAYLRLVGDTAEELRKYLDGKANA